MFVAVKVRRVFSKYLSLLLLLTFIQVIAPTQSAQAVGPTPVVTFDVSSGAVPYTGTAGYTDSKMATGLGSTITFTITLTGLTIGTAPTGQVRMVQQGGSDNHVFCTSESFSFAGTSATATCNWKVIATTSIIFRAEYLTDPRTSTDYASVTSASNLKIFTAAIYGVQGIPNQMETGTVFNIITQIEQDFGGTVSFFANGVAITAANNNNKDCQNVAISAAQALCEYKVPNGAKSITFTFDYTPDSSKASGLAKQVGSYPVEATVRKYYYPDESSWNTSPEKGYGSTYDLTYLQNNFYNHNGIFYKLNAANGQAMVASYNRDTITTTLAIPSSFDVTSFAAGSVFNRTYTVTQIGRQAFYLNQAGPPATLLTSITIPNTVTLIRANAFTGQCKVSLLDIPDSVRVVAAGAFSEMQSSAITGCSGARGLETLTVGSGIEAFSDNALKGSGGIRSLTFKGSPESLIPYLQNPRGFEGFQYGINGLNSGASNACKSIINYTGALTSYLRGSQATKWRFWATANGCMPNAGLTIVNQQFAPSPPPQPFAETPTVSSLMVNWSAPVSDGDSAITGYSIQYSSNSGSTWTQSSCTSCQIGDSPYLVTGLAADTSYIFRVIATNAIGNSTASVPSLPVRTLAYSSAPVFTITPAAETVTAGSATNYTLSSTYPATSYSILPSAGNGLSFNTTTGVLTGTLQAVETAVAYAVTGTNTFSSRTETYTVTVIAAPVTPPAPTPTYAPDPAQTSQISNVSQRCVKPDDIIEVNGVFDAKISNISINGETVPQSQWTQSASLVTIKWDRNLYTNIEIQIYNGQVPLLNMQQLTFVNQCALEEVKVVTPEPTSAPETSPTPKPSPEPTKVINTQPIAEMKKISNLYFALGSYLVGKSNKEQLAKIASEIMKSSVKTVLIYGHTDSQGGVDNILLSKNRAKVIVAQIRPLLKGKSIRIGWYAATKPAVRAKTPAAYGKNRRVEIWVK
jgi:outer membrane protein OmpA-like peptidoglycan-associated protein